MHETGGDGMQDTDNWLPDDSDEIHDVDPGFDAIPPMPEQEPVTESFDGAPADVDPGFDAIPSSFDLNVQDALRGAAGIDDLVDETIADIESEPVATPSEPPAVTGPFTGLEGALPGGAGTADIAGFINQGGADISGMTDTVLSGGELTDEQIAEGQHIASRGIDTSPLHVADDAYQSVRDSELDQRYKEAAHQEIIDSQQEQIEIQGTIDGAGNSINRSNQELGSGPALGPKWPYRDLLDD
jgi:hypothetical protein